MIDAPGPWGSGPFNLVAGHSIIQTEQAIVNQKPFAATWLWTQQRTPFVRLAANPDYWDTKRGPHLQEAVFRNDISPMRALELVCTTEGEVDIVTEVSPADAERVEHSKYAKLIASNAMRTVAGVINREAKGLPFHDKRARQALNLAIDRERLVKEAMFGRARPLAGLTPSTLLTALHRFPDRLSSYPRKPELAARLWQAAGGIESRPVRIAAPITLERVAVRVAADLQEVLGIKVKIKLCRHEEMYEIRRHLAEKKTLQEWDILLLEQNTQTADAPALELHRAFAGLTGEYRAGPAVPEFEALWAKFLRHTSLRKQVKLQNQIDQFVQEEALALFLCAPQALYAVNRHVEFKPYHTSFELAECQVNKKHWSRKRHIL